MSFWKDREGKEVTAKEFGSRWKDGIQRITPLQQSQATIFGQWIVLAGTLMGLVISAMTSLWWLFVILVGNLIIVATAILGTYQKIVGLKKIDKVMEALNYVDDGKEEVENGII